MRRSVALAAPIAWSERRTCQRRNASRDSGSSVERSGQQALDQVETALEVDARVHAQHALLPQVVHGVRLGLPGPPAGLALPARALVREVGVAEGAALAERLLDPLHRGSVLPQPGRPAGVADLVVEHGAPPHRELRRGHQAGGVRPVLEQQAPPVDEPLERGAVVRAETAPERQEVRALQHVDGVELDAAHVLGEADEARRGEPARARPVEVLALEEERGDGGAGERAAGAHARGAGAG